jgi:N utilization substance protein A
VRCVIKAVDKSSKSPGVVISRAAPELVMRLFEQEVPEIYDSTIIIKNCAREAGERTKIAVQSRDRDVDSVGACVGMKGMRVQSIIRELRGEKIDIIEFSDDPVVFATHALSPAKISRVSVIDAVGKHMEVIVDDSQLSLAIGKKGQNVRLAAKLLGWRIDIKSEEEKRQEVESAMAALVAPGAPVSVLIDFGLGEKLAEMLVESGIATVEKLGSMTPEDLEAIQGIGPKMVEKIQESVNAYYEQFDAEAETEPVTPLDVEAEKGVEPPTASASDPEPTASEPRASASGPEPASEPRASASGPEPTASEPRASASGPEPPDSVAAESDTIKDINSSANTPDENGEVHES